MGLARVGAGGARGGSAGVLGLALLAEAARAGSGQSRSIPPHIRAKQKLREALALIGQPREFCILVSDTVRWYLEERFDFHAPERTTEEFLYELQGTDLLTPDQKDSLGEFLKRCDLVKFAKYEPGEPELRDLHDVGGAAGGGNRADHGHAGSGQGR